MAISEINDKSLAASAVNLATNTVTGVLPAANTVANLSPGNNLIINGAMQVAQRGTSSTGQTSGGYKTVDRFKFDLTNLGTHTFSQSTDAPTGFKTALRVDCTTADASPAANDLLYCITGLEGQDLQQLKKGTSDAEKFTVSFYVKSNKTGTYVVEIYDADNTRHIANTYTISSADTWEQKTITFIGDTSGAFGNDNGGSMYLLWWIGAGTTYTSGSTPTSWASVSNANRAAGLNVNIADNTANDWAISGVQIEVGPVATPFDHRSYGEELALCQRYFYIGLAGGTGGFGNGSFRQNNESQIQCIHPQVMRANPTATLRASGSVVIHDTNDGNNINVTAIQSTLFNSQKGAMLGLTLASSSGVVGEGCWTYGGTSTPGITFDAEL